MKAQELRIGNYLTKYGKIVNIVEIGIKHHTDTNYYLRCEGDNCGYWINQFDPIPLTEEMLLKCGFKAKNVYDDFELNGIRIQSTVMRCDTNERSSFFLNLGEENESFNNRLDSLHQLQNIFYILTNQELEIKL